MTGDNSARSAELTLSDKRPAVILIVGVNGAGKVRYTLHTVIST